MPVLERVCAWGPFAPVAQAMTRAPIIVIDTIAVVSCPGHWD
jgi:hypothetical protein